MKTTMSADGRITIPAALRARDGLAAGQTFEVSRVQAGEYRLTTAIAAEATSSEGTRIVAWLQSCPETGWFQPLPRS